MKIIFETERLTIREFSTQDAQFIIKLLNTEGWLKYIGNRNIHSTNDALQYINKLNDYSQKNGFGFWAVELKNNKNLIGLCGLIKRDELEFIDIGFAFLPIYNKQGFAFEAAYATLNFAKEKLQIETIAAITIAENQSSIKLIERLGLHFKKEITMDDELLMYYEKSV
jgi:RimJ/RimL family protein N-acetyltransferase